MRPWPGVPTPASPTSTPGASTSTASSSAPRQWPARTPRRTRHETPEEFLRLLVARGNFIFVSATARREALEAAGYFNTSLRSVEDLDMWIRILAAGYGAVRAGRRLAIKRDRFTSMSGNATKMAASLRDVYRLAETYHVPADVRETAREHAERIDREIAAVEGGGALHGAGQRLRRLGGTLRQRAGRGRIWYPETPPEIAAAFPSWPAPATDRRPGSATGDAREDRLEPGDLVLAQVLGGEAAPGGREPLAQHRVLA